MSEQTKVTKQAPELTADQKKALKGESTVSGQIRVLAKSGMPRADIARVLGKRYQHVRNVLVEDARKASK